MQIPALETTILRRASSIALLVAAIAGAVAAAAAAGYTIRLNAPFVVRPGNTFDVRVTGSAPKRSVLNVFLDRKTCASGAQQEGARNGSNATPRSGDSYFVSPEGARVTFYSVPVRGSFDRVAVAHAGTKQEQEHLCSYLNVLGASTPASVARATRIFAVR